ncbi:hypothetical protein ACFWUP_23595 [Nocardia sp. NPDC058658]|uniref:hypothetical protein n=1 Tax=Nocardia sp. NPDC058658 TaxID=3346580 RepID=UPI0036648A15
MSADPAYARQLFAAAEAGTFVLTEEAARECAGHFSWYADRLVAFQDKIKEQRRLAGFGGFESAGELQAGFEAKADQGYDALVHAERVAHQMAAAIYRAAGLLGEVDAANAAAQNAIAKEVPEQ